MPVWMHLALIGGVCLVGGLSLAGFALRMDAPNMESNARTGVIAESGWDIPIFMGLLVMLAGIIILFVALVEAIAAAI